MKLSENHSSFLLIIYGYILLFTGCHSPQKEISHPDEIKVQATLDTYKDSLSVSPVVFMDTLTKLQQQITDSLVYYRLSNQIVKGCYYANLTDSFFKINQRVINFCERQSPDRNIAELAWDAYNSRGVLLTEYNRIDTAIICFEKTYHLMNQYERKKELPTVCINLAECYHQEGDYTLSSYFYRKALAITDSLQMGNDYNYPIFTGIAKLYHELENYELAEEYYKRAETLVESTTNDYDRLSFINSYGTYHFMIKAYDEALACFRKADQIARNQARQYNQGIAQGNMAEVFILKEEPDSARYYLDCARESLGDLSRQPALNFYINGLYASLALLENNLAEAERLLMQPYDTRYINPQYLYFYHKRLHNLYLKKQDFRKAYQYYARAVEYNDSLRHMKIQNNIAEIDSRYRQDTILIRKDMQIALTESRASQWQNIAVFSIIFLILFAALVAGIILYNRKLRELKYQKQVAMITGLRMEIVRNRLSPHFMFNALNTVMPTLESYNELKQPFSLLIQLLRNNLQASEQIAIPLDKEITLVKDFLELHTLKETTNIRIIWQIDDEVPMQSLIPSMSIQIPVENAVKYAFTADNPDPSIRIQVRCLSGNLHIIIEDNGQGYQGTTNMNDQRGTGSGLKMLHRTIEILNTKNSRKMSFSIVNRHDSHPTEKGTRVTLIVPSSYHFEL